MSAPGESRSQCKQVAGKQNSQAGQLDINPAQSYFYSTFLNQREETNSGCAAAGWHMTHSFM